MPPETDFSPDKIARIKTLYTAGAVPLSHILTEEKISRHTLNRLCQQFAWPLRPPKSAKAPDARRKTRPIRRKIVKKPKPVSQKSIKPRLAKQASSSGASNVMAMVRRLTNALQGELAAAEQRRASASPATAEASARTLASIARTLTTLHALKKNQARRKIAPSASSADKMDSLHDAPSIDLAELRRELSRRIDRLRSDRESS